MGISIPHFLFMDVGDDFEEELFAVILCGKVETASCVCG